MTLGCHFQVPAINEPNLTAWLESAAATFGKGRAIAIAWITSVSLAVVVIWHKTIAKTISFYLAF